MTTTSATIRSVMDDMMTELVASVSSTQSTTSDDDTSDGGDTPSSFPTLYTTDKAGKTRSWTITVDGNKVTKVYGLVDGKQITDTRSYEGKNVGRSNETTPEEQALLEAQRDWKKQTEKGYKPSTSFTTTKTTTTKSSTTKPASANGSAPSIERPIIPMKCQVWEDATKVTKHFDFTRSVYVQPKYDGVRATATAQSDGSLVLLSNTSKQFIWLKTLREEIKTFLGDSGVTLDGELYAHVIKSSDGTTLDHVQRFGVISGACRPVRSNPSEYEEQIGYHVFDVVDTVKPQTERMKVLDELFANNQSSRIVRAPTTRVESVEEIDAIHDEYTAQEYEGVIIRAHDLMYQLKHRSLKMRKLKKFIDAEFEVVGAQMDKGTNKEDFVWMCITDKGKKFKVKPEGSADVKHSWYDNRKKFVGKMLTVKYQDISADGVPRFPIGKGFRHSADLEGGYDSE